MKPPKKWIRGIEPDDSVFRAARRTLKSRLGGVLYYLPAAAHRSEESHEYVHQLRVWTRRSGAALALYGELLPRKRLAKMKKRLKKIRRAAGAARDLDVLIKFLESRQDKDCAAVYLCQVKQTRLAAQQPIVDIDAKMKDDRFQQKTDKLLAHLRQREKRTGDSSQRGFGAWARRRAASYVDSFFDAAPPAGAPLDALHQFRIRGKTLRYAMELTACAFPKKLRKQVYPAIVELQDKLGRVNDLCAAQARFRAQQQREADPRIVDYLDKLIREDEARLQHALADFHDYWTPQRCDKLRKQFQKLLDC